jgi:hypothetical protein
MAPSPAKIELRSRHRVLEGLPTYWTGGSKRWSKCGLEYRKPVNVCLRTRKTNSNFARGRQRVSSGLDLDCAKSPARFAGGGRAILSRHNPVTPDVIATDMFDCFAADELGD